MMRIQQRASRTITYVEDPGFDGGPDPSEGKTIVKPVNDPIGVSDEQAASPLYSEPANAGVMRSIGRQGSPGPRHDETIVSSIRHLERARSQSANEVSERVQSRHHQARLEKRLGAWRPARV